MLAVCNIPAHARLACDPDRQTKPSPHHRSGLSLLARSSGGVRVVASAACSTVENSKTFDVKELFQWSAQMGVRGSGLAFATGKPSD